MQNNIINPKILHQNLVEAYLLLNEALVKKVELLCQNKVGKEIYKAELNTSITLLKKEDQGGGTIYYTLFWEQFDQEKTHIINAQENGGKWVVYLKSCYYTFAEADFTVLNKKDPVELYKNYISLYEVNEQLERFLNILR